MRACGGEEGCRPPRRRHATAPRLGRARDLTTRRLLHQRAFAFNQPLASWNVSLVDDLRQTFWVRALPCPAASARTDAAVAADVDALGWARQLAYAFNQSLQTWDVAQVTDMYGLFYVRRIASACACLRLRTGRALRGRHAPDGCPPVRWQKNFDFNHPLPWATSKVTTMEYMFDVGRADPPGPSRFATRAFSLRTARRPACAGSLTGESCAPFSATAVLQECQPAAGLGRWAGRQYEVYVPGAPRRADRLRAQPPFSDASRARAVQTDALTLAAPPRTGRTRGPSTSPCPGTSRPRAWKSCSRRELPRGRSRASGLRPIAGARHSARPHAPPAQNARAFNQALDWDVPSEASMSEMFYVGRRASRSADGAPI